MLLVMVSEEIVVERAKELLGLSLKAGGSKKFPSEALRSAVNLAYEMERTSEDPEKMSFARYFSVRDKAWGRRVPAR